MKRGTLASITHLAGRYMCNAQELATLRRADVIKDPARTGGHLKQSEQALAKELVQDKTTTDNCQCMLIADAAL